jgi:multisubunit Na+/H+ antiporter MnhF subunit
MAYYETLLAVYLCISGLCCIIVTWHLPKYKHTPLILAPIVLWLGFVTETSAVIHHHFISYYSGWIFNIYNFFYFILLYSLVYRYLKNARFKITIIILGTGALSFFVYRLTTGESFNDRCIYSNTVLVIVLLISCIFYLIELLKSKTMLVFRKHPEFFFLGGYLIFNLVYTPLNVAYDMKLRLFSNEFYIFLKSIQGFVLIAMNFLFIYIFTWTKKAHL